MVHQTLDIAVHLFFFRQRNTGVINTNRAARNTVQGLLNDGHALFDFLKAHGETVVIVALGAGRDVKLKTLIARVGLRLAHIVGDTGCAQQRPGEAVRNRIFRRHDANPGHAVNEYPILGQQRVTVTQEATYIGKRRPHALGKVLWQIVRDTTDPGIADRQAGAGHGRDQIVQGLTRFHQIEPHGNRAGFSRGHTQTRQMVSNPRNLTHDDPDILAAFRDLNVKQAFGRQGKGHIINEW